MKKIAIVFPDTREMGGGSIVAAGFIKFFLEKENYFIHLYGIEKVSDKFITLLNQVCNNVEIDKRLKLIVIKNYKYSFPKSQYFLAQRLIFENYLFKKDKYDIYVHTFGLKETIPKIKENKLFIQYLHFPTEYIYFKYRKIFFDRYKKFKFFYPLLLFLYLYYNSDKIFKRHKTVNKICFVNSKFTNFFCNNKYKVLYPPVFFNFKSNRIDIKKKENLIISIQRYHPCKKIENLIKLAKLLQHYNLDIKIINIGSISSKTYYEKLVSIKQKLGLKNLKLLPSMQHSKVMEYLSKAKFYLQTTKYESFGIAVVEAMYCGCIPVVHKFSAPFYDILDKGKYGFGYLDETEILNFFLEEKYKKYSVVDIKERAKDFSYEKFANRLEKYLSEKL